MYFLSSVVTSLADRVILVDMVVIIAETPDSTVWGFWMLYFCFFTLVLARKGVDTVDVSWEQGGFFYVADTTVFGS